MTKQTVIMIAGAGAVLAAISVVETSAEVMPYLVGGVSPAQRFGAIVSGDFAPASSRWSRDLFLTDCLEVPRTIFGLAQPPARRHQFQRTCRDRATEVVATAPTMSNAWLVIAAASADLEDFATMRTGLAKSKSSAPKLQWLADRRSGLAEREMAELDATNLADYEDDIAVLARGIQGIEVLAQRYARRPASRALYTRIVEAADVGQQGRFVARVHYYLAETQK